MNKLTDDLTGQLEPKMAIIVYGEHGSFYLERRDIRNGRMVEGVPLTEECLADISEVLSQTTSKMVHGIVPPFMLKADPRPGKRHYIWYRTPETRRMFFSNKLNIPAGEVKLPGLIYEVTGETLSIYAVKCKRAPKAKTKLYRGPFFNVYNNGSVCLGSAKAKKPLELSFFEIIRYWEEKFWFSEFDHMLDDNPVKGNLSTITKHCIKTGEPFPLNELKPIRKKTLKDLL